LRSLTVSAAFLKLFAAARTIVFISTFTNGGKSPTIARNRMVGGVSGQGRPGPSKSCGALGSGMVSCSHHMQEHPAALNSGRKEQ
jgi:hypothetical protein